MPSQKKDKRPLREQLRECKDALARAETEVSKWNQRRGAQHPVGVETGSADTLESGESRLSQEKNRARVAAVSLLIGIVFSALIWGLQMSDIGGLLLGTIVLGLTALLIIFVCWLYPTRGVLLIWAKVAATGISVLLYGLFLFRHHQIESSDASALRCDLFINRAPDYPVGKLIYGVPWRRGGSLCLLRFSAEQQISDVDLVVSLDAYIYGASSADAQTRLRPWPDNILNVEVWNGRHKIDEPPDHRPEEVSAYAVRIANMSPNQPVEVYLFVPKTSEELFDKGAAVGSSDPSFGARPLDGPMNPTTIKIGYGSYRVVHGDNTHRCEFSPAPLKSRPLNSDPADR